MDAEVRKRLMELGDAALSPLGCYVVELQVEFGRNRSILRYFIDRIEGRVTVDDCARGSRLIEAAIEEKSAFGGEYVMEISSPGIERRIARERDFKRFAGAVARVRTRTPMDGQRNFEGTIAGCDGQSVTLKIGDKERKFPYALIARANLVGEAHNREGSHGN